MPFRLAASDLDGTLLRSDDSLAPRTREVIHRVAAQSLFVYATGRPPRWVHPVAEASGHRGLAVCSNGAVTLDLRDESVVDERPIRPAVALELLEAVLSVADGAVFAVDGPGGFAHDPAYVPYWPTGPEVRVAPVRELFDVPLYKMLFRHDAMNAEMLRRVVEAVGSRGSVTYGSMVPVPGRTTLIEIMAPDVTKATALARIADHHGFDAEHVIAFGDMPNDVHMLEWAGHGVAMANAHPDAKAVADEITATNDDDGVAIVLERLYGAA